MHLWNWMLRYLCTHALQPHSAWEVRSTEENRLTQEGTAGYRNRTQTNGLANKYIQGSSHLLTPLPIGNFRRQLTTRPGFMWPRWRRQDSSSASAGWEVYGGGLSVFLESLPRVFTPRPKKSTAPLATDPGPLAPPTGGLGQVHDWHVMVHELHSNAVHPTRATKIHRFVFENEDVYAIEADPM